MDNATVMKLMNKQQEDLKEFISVSMSLNHAKVILELDPIKEKLHSIEEQNVIRNGRIEANENKIDCNKNETWFARWIQKHPLPAAIIFLAMILLGALAVDMINLNKTIENVTGIVVDE